MGKRPIDYSKTWFYYIQIGDKRYYGHSTEKYVSLYQSHHRSLYRFAIKNNKLTRKLHKDMYTLNMTPEDINLTFIEYYKCKDINEATKREREHCESYDKSLLSNAVVPSRTQKEWYDTNKEDIKEQKKQYREANKVQIKEQVKQYYEANKEHIKEQRKQYREANKEHIKEKGKQYREANKDKIAEQKKQTYECPCGSILTKNHIERHKRSQKHIKWLEHS